jgi:hypothetical protein
MDYAPGQWTWVACKIYNYFRKKCSVPDRRHLVCFFAVRAQNLGACRDVTKRLTASGAFQRRAGQPEPIGELLRVEIRLRAQLDGEIVPGLIIQVAFIDN